jgi:hypothetical protein
MSSIFDSGLLPLAAQLQALSLCKCPRVTGTSFESMLRLRDLDLYDGVLSLRIYAMIARLPRFEQLSMAKSLDADGVLRDQFSQLLRAKCKFRVQLL